MESRKRALKCVFVGDSGTGKTTLVNLCLSNEFTVNHIPTLGVEVHPIDVSTEKHGDFRFDAWDTAGLEKFGGLRDGYYLAADCAVVFCDLTRRETIPSIERWYRDFTRTVHPDKRVPVVICGSHSDVLSDAKKNKEARELLPKQIVTKSDNVIPFVALSSKTGHNVEKLFETILKELLRDATVKVKPFLRPIITNVERLDEAPGFHR